LVISPFDLEIVSDERGKRYRGGTPVERYESGYPLKMFVVYWSVFDIILAPQEVLTYPSA
jgi:hypothetical protein